jgi:hypothetical protein
MANDSNNKKFIKFSSKLMNRTNETNKLESSSDADNDERKSFLKFSSKDKPSNLLHDGKKLPKEYQKMFTSSATLSILNGIPLEEIDDYYKRNEHTFIVVNNNKQIFRFSSEKALFIFRPECVFRRWAIYLLTHSFFSALVMITILANCVVMTLPWDKVPHFVE